MNHRDVRGPRRARTSVGGNRAIATVALASWVIAGACGGGGSRKHGDAGAGGAAGAAGASARSGGNGGGGGRGTGASGGNGGNGENGGNGGNGGAAGDAGGPSDAAQTDAGVGADIDVGAGTNDGPSDPLTPGTLVRIAGFASGLGRLCGLGYDGRSSTVWVYPCSGATLHGFSSAGTAVSTLDAPGEAADDVDLDVSPGKLILGTTALPGGTLLFANGETDVVEIFAINPTSMAPIGSLTTGFGASHVVGASFHAGRRTVFAVQDRVPGSTVGNVIAEMDAATGAVRNMFSVLPNYNVNYGDLDVCQSTGNVFVVSDSEDGIAEFAPTGQFLREHALPADVVGLSGIGIDDTTGEAWVSGTGGMVSRLGGLPCP